MANVNQTYVAFRCDCGTHFRVRSALAGRYGICNQCGKRILIPQVNGQVVATEAVPPVRENEFAEICAVCQSPINEGDKTTTCTACDLPYHAECWDENLGCATYGCAEVDALKTAPDITIAPTDVPPVEPARWPDGHEAALPSSSDPISDDSIPWEFVLLPISILAAIASVVLAANVSWAAYGIPPFIAGGWTRDYWKKAEQPNTTVLVLTLCICVLGFIVGWIIRASQH